MRLIIRFALTAVAVFLIATYVPGISLSEGWKTALYVALVWSLISLIVKPILSILTLPLTLITFGLFSFILNAILFFAMTYIISGFSVEGIIPALIGSVVLSLVSSLTRKF